MLISVSYYVKDVKDIPVNNAKYHIIVREYLHPFSYALADYVHIHINIPILI